MNQFYLNSAIGVPKSIEEGSKALEKVLLSFGKLLEDKNLNVSSDVVMDCEMAMVKFGETYLYQIVDALENSDMKTLAWTYFQRAYPLTDYVGMKDEEYACVERSYMLDGEDATALSVANNHRLLLLSIAHKQSLQQDRLTVKATTPAPDGNKYPDAFVMDNLYGDADNEGHIIEQLQQRVVDDTAKLDQLKAYGVTLPTVEKQFKKLCVDEQNEIIEHFKEAKRMGLLYPINPNNSIVRSESGWKKYMVVEVALPNPYATRVYISQNDNQLYISYIGHKRDYDGTGKQRKDIRRAEKLFKEYLGLK